MEPIKIYLSKSKSGNIDDILKIKKILSNYENIEVLEFEGGEYNTVKLQQADLVLIIPPELPKPFSDNFTIGKGQFTEALDALPPVYYVVSHNELEINVIREGYVDVDVLDIDWKTRYAKINCDLDEIEYLFEDVIEHQTGVTPIFNIGQKHDHFSFAPIALENSGQNAIQNTVFAKPMLALYKKQ